ncbi:MAG: hypothetical protein Q7R87_04780 [Nanoarchaeota archaeon]|nr:hypothetical protein [Nanoarchaeota archaeon]
MISFFKNRMNKRGGLGDEVSIVYFIFLFVIIGLGLTWGTYSFFGGGYDVREVQAKWLGNEIQNCLTSKSVDLASKDDFFIKCNLNENVLREKEFVVRICDVNCYNNKKEPLFSVNSNYQLCGFTEVTSKNAPRCSEKNFELNGKDIHLIVGSKINPRRVS